jgi:leucyl/phenylalanyl-tRNA--protein transferase
MIKAYSQLHEAGAAHSAEAWQAGELVGGLYGVSLGGVFFGESMFALVPDASKVAFATLVAQLVAWGFGMIDCQTHTAHLERFGATLIPRQRFLRELAVLVDQPGRACKWQLEVTPAQVCAR